MFLANLSNSILRICGTKDLSYESASELCDLSSRYFGDIVRQKSAPSIVTLEKLRIGLEQSPNELLGVSSILHDISYREPMKVTQIKCYRSFNALSAFPVCPRCQTTLEREYQHFCDRCGQKLSWRGYRKAVIKSAGMLSVCKKTP